ncbi:MAG TPA: cellulase family glycosylhydrolase, partial [Planctomycetota bacterium]|nr:cellulase family glycosylhydrolase [Planctomycetota bacterium]
LGFLDHPLTLTVANRLVLEIHEYGRDVSDQPWYHATNFPANLEADDWNKFWEFIMTQNLAPIWVGEWGSKDDPTEPYYSLDHPWLLAFHDFIKAKQLSWTWWTWSPLSADTGGILNADFTTVNTAKMSLLQDVLYPAFAATGSGTPPPPPPPPSGPGSPYGGIPASIPGTVQAENYDLGGQGVGYSNTDTVNHFGQYRTDGVSIEVTSDTGGGYDVGWISPGEWLDFTVTVAASGSYDVSFRVASATTGGTLHLETGGTNLTGTVTVPGTGGWQTWQSLPAVPLTLSAGTQTLRLVFDSGSLNLNYMTFSASGSGPGGTPAPPGGGSPMPSSSGAGGGGGGGGCGCTGLEVLFVVGLALRRSR